MVAPIKPPILSIYVAYVHYIIAVIRSPRVLAALRHHSGALVSLSLPY